MYDKIDNIYNDYKTYIETNSKYGTRVVKYNTNTSTHFPLVTCIVSDNMSTNECTIDKIEEYEAYYFTLNFYAKNKTRGTNIVVASQVIIDELVWLTQKYFVDKLNMKKTQNKPVPNIDTSILRQVMQFQCYIGKARGNIIRR